jgi:hypothetical protein
MQKYILLSEKSHLLWPIGNKNTKHIDISPFMRTFAPQMPPLEFDCFVRKESLSIIQAKI